MTDAAQKSAEEAICQVIADGGVAEFADVVNEVQRRFHLDVTSTQVEQVYRGLVNKKAQLEERPSARIDLQMTSTIPDKSPVKSEMPGSPAEAKPDELGVALRFVKSVGGLENAKRLLYELESSLKG